MYGNPSKGGAVRVVDELFVQYYDGKVVVVDTADSEIREICNLDSI